LEGDREQVDQGVDGERVAVMALGMGIIVLMMTINLISR
jgi:hypothetical protein